MDILSLKLSHDTGTLLGLRKLLSDDLHARRVAVGLKRGKEQNTDLMSFLFIRLSSLILIPFCHMMRHLFESKGQMN